MTDGGRKKLQAEIEQLNEHIRVLELLAKVNETAGDTLRAYLLIYCEDLKTRMCDRVPPALHTPEYLHSMTADNAVYRFAETFRTSLDGAYESVVRLREARNKLIEKLSTEDTQSKDLTALI